MEGMFTDLTSAKEDQSHFEEYLSKNPSVSPGFDFHMTVLTGRFWPGYKSSDLNLPAEMVKCVEVFEDFYQQTTKQNKLTWIYSLDSCNINGNFEPKTMELIVTTYQFTDKMRKIKIPITPDDEKKKVIEDVDQDRQYTIEASIVRIMKYIKVHGYQQLVLECVEQMKRIFKPDQEAIKKRIEDLITHEFLERDNCWIRD
ncbi:hypothetical protein L2E82_51142 [Cichorium intybus]|nr:hypothetical protein L2E82_51142 [Cichorium intybus]